MLTKDSSGKELMAVPDGRIQSLSRRRFLGYIGGASALLVTAAACKKDDNNIDNGLDLGSGDIGVLNYAYALEQIEAAFYKKISDAPYTGITAAETSLLADIRDHEIAHREFFKNALGAKAIPALELDFSSIDFTSRTSVLATAKTFEDLGVTAYNGAGKLIVDPNYLALAGKIVSVEARHAAYIRDLISNGTFADNTAIDMNGLDMARTPNEVLTMAASFVKTKLNASNLPTS